MSPFRGVHYTNKDLARYRQVDKYIREAIGPQYVAALIPETTVPTSRDIFQPTEQELKKCKNQKEIDNLLAWYNSVNDLEKYKRQHGNCNVSQEGGKHKLGNWVNKQRAEKKIFDRNIQHETKKRTSMTHHRIRVLESLGFEWLTLLKGEKAWNKNYKALLEYQKAHGTLNVPTNMKILGRWVSTQRREYRNRSCNQKHKMTDEHVQMLEAIGFDFNPRNRRNDNNQG